MGNTIDITKVLQEAKTSIGLHGTQAMFAQVSERRDVCAERGYHRVEKHGYDDKPKGERCICVDCEVFFGKGDNWITVQTFE